MAFFHQLKVLLWKNFSLRKRQPLRNIIEIFWPLALFIILVLVRQRRPPENINHSFYKPRALPSAGALPFLQSFLCDFANENINSPQDLPDFSNGSLYKVIQDLSPLIQNQTNLNLVTRLFIDYEMLREALQELNVLNITSTFKSGASLSSLLKDSSVVKKFILDHTKLNETYVNALMDSPINFDKASEFYLPFLQDLQDPSRITANILTLPSRLKTVLCEKPGIKQLFDMPTKIYEDNVQNQLCKFSTFEWIQFGRDLVSGIDLNALNSSVRNIQNFQRFESTWRLLTRRTISLSQDLQALQSVTGLLQDVNSLRGFVNQSGILDVRSLICGRKVRKRPREEASFYQQIREQAAEETRSKPEEGTVCSDIKPQSRVDCGWPGISEGTCLSMGCCYDSSIPNTKYCFCKPGQQRCCVVFNQFVHTVGGVTGRAGAGYSDSGFVMFAALILRGKIYYTPDNPKTRLVIQKVNSFISQIDSSILSAGRLKRPLQAILNYTEAMQNSSRFSNVKINRDTITEVLRLGGMLGNPTVSRYADLLNRTEVFDFLDNIGAWRNQTRRLYSFLDLTENLVKCFNTSDFFQPFPSEKSLVQRAVDQSPGHPLFLSSVVFMNLDDDVKEFPKKVEYKLRLNPDFTPGTDKVRSKYWRPGPGPYGGSGFTTLSYINFGFVFLQDLVDRAFMEILTNKTIPEPGVYVQQFPYPCYIRDRFTRYISRTMPLFMTLAWVYTVAMIVKSIVYEKELRLKEVMKIMGLSNSVHWTAWFITSLIVMLITVILQCILWKVGGILQHSDPTLVFFMLLVFAIASINLCFLISIFFSKANIAAACGGIIYFFTYLPYPITIWFEEQMSASHKSLAGLLSTTAFGMGCQYLARFEEQGIGVQWNNYYKSPLPDDNYNLGMTINMMMLDALLYFLLVWYFEKVMPGEYGVPKPWYFPFTKSYWLGKEEVNGALFLDESHGNGVNSVIELPEFSNGAVNGHGTLFTRVNADFEQDPPMSVGVHIQNLVKIYRRGNKKAVDGLNLKLFEGQVTSLLGHNGAGKSTTMSVLTGLFPPSGGTALVYGKDIRTDMDSIRYSMGMCPQHNVLFDDMTVEEHMWFYAKLKGMNSSDIPNEVVKFLHDVGLPDKRGELAKNLSGGMKRKLSVALAFIANSRTVILDEPTAGVDPYSRRGIWDLILKYKEGRTILLSTHYMDEADLLGDRISIINNGRLKCCGSSLFLKRRFGKGYFLTLVKDPNSKTVFNEEALTKFITSFVPSGFLKEHVGAEISYVLPSSSRETGAFGKLFRNLESSLSNFGVTDYGISDTTLEEVFLSACNEESTPLGDEDNISLTGPLQRRRKSTVNPDTISINSQTSDTLELIRSSSRDDNETALMAPAVTNKMSLWLQQFLAVVIKRFHHARRSRKGFFSQIVLPAVFVAAAMVVALLRPPRHALPAFKLSPSQYGNERYSFVQNRDRSTSSQGYALTKALVENPGPGCDCVKPASCLGRSVKYPFFNYDNLWKEEQKEFPPCACQSGKQHCSKSQLGPNPPQAKLTTGDIMVDLSTRNVSDYILKTMKKMIKMRYGGISFGEISRFFPEVNTSAFSQNNLLASTSGVRQNAKVWFNNKGFHAMPIYLNVINNAILRANLNATQHPDEYGIVAYNHPMDYNKEQLGEETMMQGFTDLFVAIFVIVALSFVPASFVVYLVSDKISKSKHLQFVNGLHPVIYWLANYCWDLINYLIPAFCCLIIFLAFNQKSYVSADNFPVTLSLLLLYGWSMIPLMYPSSFVFQVPSTAYIVLICGNLFVGIVGTISTFILELFQDDQELLDINAVLKNVFLIFPNYCLGRGLMDLARNQFESEIYARFGEVKFKDPFTWDLVGRNLFAMFIGGIAFMGINLLIQYRFFIGKRFQKSPLKGIRMDEDEDILQEKDRVLSRDSIDEDAVRVLDITKMYIKRFSKKTTLAVDHLTFGVQKGECFGLLGVNGAGKTTTFKILTGDTVATSGNAFVGPHSILTDMNRAHQLMGYCPQFDALDELLTGREMLTYYARIKGFGKQQSKEIVEWAIDELGLTQYRDVVCGDYSGGNKRKLSTALALLGYPPVIFLDEPTTGMDPSARRFLWNVILDVIREGRSVVLTSHSMEECETLCSRLAIMVNGKFMCFGSPQHLRSKYGDGYTLVIRAKYNEVPFCKEFIVANFPHSKLKDEHYNMLEYQLPTSELKLSQVFDILESLRNTNTIYDYSVSQTTLDQIFVNFARAQTEGVEFIAEENKYNLVA